MNLLYILYSSVKFLIKIFFYKIGFLPIFLNINIILMIFIVF